MHSRVLLYLMAAAAVTLVSGEAMAQIVRGPAAIRPREAPAAPEVIAHPPSCVEAYWNVGVPAGMYFPAGTNVEVLDDLHLGGLSTTDVCAFDVGCFNTGGPTTANVRFYAGNAADDAPGAVLATFPALAVASGESYLHVEVPGLMPGLDVWMGASFASPNAGLQLAHPAWPGASDDYFYMKPANNFFTFGGNPAANFVLAVYAIGSPSDVEPGAGLVGFIGSPGPNPSVQGVHFRFALPSEGRVQIEVFDAAGRMVARLADQRYVAGVHAVSWDRTTTGGGRAAAGVYLLRLRMPGFAGSRKVTLLD